MLVRPVPPVIPGSSTGRRSQGNLDARHPMPLASPPGRPTRLAGPRGLDQHRISRFARWSVIFSFVLGMAGQVAYPRIRSGQKAARARVRQ